MSRCVFFNHTCWKCDYFSSLSLLSHVLRCVKTVTEDEPVPSFLIKLKQTGLIGNRDSVGERIQTLYLHLRMTLTLKKYYITAGKIVLS